MADIVRPEVLERALQLHRTGDIPGAYRVLADAGDVYAERAWAITNNASPNPLDAGLDAVVSVAWALGAPDLKEAKFKLSLRLTRRTI